MKWHLQLLWISSLCLTLAIVRAVEQNKEGSSKVGKNDDQFGQRVGKSLRNTFPFNRNNDDHHHQHHQHDQHESHQSRSFSRQGAGDSQSLDIGSIAAAGERCIDKVVMTEETEYDDVIKCKHSYTERCHVTYKTDYTPQQEEECDETYKKNCYIDYKQVAFKEKVKFCYTPLVKNCNLPAPTECTTEYQSQCTTRYHEHKVEDDVPNCVEEQEVKCQQVTQGYSTEEQCTRWPVKKCSLERQSVTKVTPETQCQKVPFEICGPAACPVEPGPEQCQDKEETIVQEVPEEMCTLEPRRECKHVTKLVPKLEPHENCIDVPKEVCVRTRENPRRVQKPVIKKWCYTPSPESGLEGFGGSKSEGNVTPRPTRPPVRTTRPPPRTTRPPEGCARGYPFDYCPTRAGDGRCHPECNTARCGYDGGDCVQTTPPPQGCAPGYPVDHCPRRANNRRCDPECNTAACGYDNGECEVRTTPAPQGCAPGYPVDHCPRRANNRRCDPECNTAACGYDNNECYVQTTVPPSIKGYLPPPQNGGYRNY